MPYERAATDSQTSGQGRLSDGGQLAAAGNDAGGSHDGSYVAPTDLLGPGSDAASGGNATDSAPTDQLAPALDASSPDFGAAGGSTLFVSVWRQGGGFGRSEADRICNSEAAAAGLAGSFRAILSDASEQARDLEEQLRYPIRTPGDRVLETANLWDGSGIKLPLTLATGSTIVDPIVWTGSTATGERGQSDCQSWTELFTTARGVTSLWSSGSIYWLGHEGPGSYCNTQARLYCVQVFP